jgi:hypothetical protein
MIRGRQPFSMNNSLLFFHKEKNMNNSLLYDI